jgi:hypothetical protein
MEPTEKRQEPEIAASQENKAEKPLNDKQKKWAEDAKKRSVTFLNQLRNRRSLRI